MKNRLYFSYINVVHISYWTSGGDW